MQTNYTNYIVNDLIKQGKDFIIEDFNNKELTYNFVKNIILKGIEEIEGIETRKTIEKVGLSKLHEHFHVDNLWHLEKIVENGVRQEVLKMTYEVGKDSLSLEGEFFIDNNINIRINYPFTFARLAKLKYEDYIQNRQLNSQTDIQKQFNKSVQLKIAVKDFTSNLLGRGKSFVTRTFKSSQKQHDQSAKSGLNKITELKIEGKAKYFKNLPYAASAKFAHGPHLDTWFGHSYDGINLWWAIDGVTEDNGIILYPELFEKHLEHLEEPPYIIPGITLPKPYKIAPKAGSILIFNPEVLHGTQLNVSDFTRIVISTRLNPNKPLFDPNIINYHMKFWYSSKDFAMGNFDNVLKFTREENLGKLRIKNVDQSTSNHPIIVELEGKELNEIPVEVCTSAHLPLGQKILIKFRNESVVMIRNIHGISALRATCPHVGINLIDGFHDEKNIYCPGHGLAFNISDGSSQCDLLKLKVYNVYEKDDKIFISK